MSRGWLGARWLGKTGASGSGKERREQRQRVARYFDCTWLSQWGEERARVSSLSPTGCYIESRRSVPAEGTVVHELTIALPTGTVTLQGTVVDAMSGVGFAVRFTDLDAPTRDCLNVLIHIP